MKHIILPILAVAGALTLGACDSKQENARQDAVEKKADAVEDKADAVRKDAEKKADAIEDKKKMANDHSTNVQLENQADATRKAAEQKADGMENQADAIRDGKAAPMGTATPNP
ncbi:MAG: hypothetical protein ABIR71_14505 [Chthoniobacterales bacterium]